MPIATSVLKKFKFYTFVLINPKNFVIFNMVQIAGKYNFVSQDNFEEYLKAAGNTFFVFSCYFFKSKDFINKIIYY